MDVHIHVGSDRPGVVPRAATMRRPAGRTNLERAQPKEDIMAVGSDPEEGGRRTEETAIGYPLSAIRYPLSVFVCRERKWEQKGSDLRLIDEIQLTRPWKYRHRHAACGILHRSHFSTGIHD